MLRKNELSGQALSDQSELRRYRRAEMLSLDRGCRRSRSISPSSSFRRARCSARSEQCAAAGVRNAVIISSGFAEEGGDSAAMQDAIAELAETTGMRISGPNAEGFYSEAQRVAATFSPTVDVKPGEHAAGRDQAADRHRRPERRHRLCDLSPRQGARHRAQLRRQRRQRIRSRRRRISRLHGAGCLDRRDPAVHRGHPRRRQVSRRRPPRRGNWRKPVIVTKVGRSGAGERAAASHTASMAGWSAAYDAVFAKYGFIVSNDLDEAVTIAAVLTTNPMPKGDRVAVLTVSGGAGIWGADTVSMQGLQVPELSAPIQAEIRKTAAVLWRGAQPDRRHRARRAFRRPAEEHRPARRLRRGRRHPGGAVAVERDADAVQAGGTEAGDSSAAQADRVLLLHAAVRSSRGASLRHPASWCCRG